MASSPVTSCLHSRPFPPRCISRRAAYGKQSSHGHAGVGQVASAFTRGDEFLRARKGAFFGGDTPGGADIAFAALAAPAVWHPSCSAEHAAAAQRTFAAVKRRVQLVPRDGRDVSTLYGREGGGGGSKRGRARPQAPRRVTCHAREGPAAQLLRRKVPRLVRHARGRCQGGRETAALPVRATAPARRLPSCQRPVRAADASGWVYGRRTETGKFCMSMYEEHYVREASP
jgi:hypothetical protein